MAVWLLILFLFAPACGYARPEFALRYNNNRCTSCHVSPVGGGPRRLNGKLFGKRFAADPGPLSQQEFFDFAVYYNHFIPRDSGTDQGGLTVMAVNASAHLPLQGNIGGDSIAAVAEHNIGGLPAGAGGPRNTYLIYSSGDSEKHVLFGRFTPPFGIPTDEHRTYTKVMTGNTWNDFETGMLASLDPSDRWHLDLAAVNGQKSAGLGFGTGQAANWGAIINMRYMAPHQPHMMGFSVSYHDSEATVVPRAAAAYYMLSLDRATRNRWSGEVLIEYAEARGWNNSLTAWVNDPGYLGAIEGSHARGVWAQANFNINRDWSLTLKYDEMVPDIDYPGDTYQRQGYGINYVWPGGASIRLRHEEGRATHPTETNESSRGAEDATWIVLKAWI